MAAAKEPEAVSHNRFGCKSCGADLEYAPGTFSMKCPYCGSETDIPIDARGPPPEHSIGVLSQLGATVATLAPDAKSINCKQCGATSQIAGGKTATECPFCGSNVVVPQAASKALIRPEGVIPFAFDRHAAHQKFVQWIQKGFFRPKAVKKSATLEAIHTTYVPYFTYDAQADSRWRGEAGTYYYTTESYTVTVNGRPERRTRQVQHVRWQWKSGVHSAFYDDVLVCASRGLTGPLVGKLEPFNTKAAVPYTDQMLAGSEAEEYSVDPREGYQRAAQKMVDTERSECSRQLGGDTQRNLQVSTVLSRQTFRHLLLPVYLASYQYKGKSWKFMVNGQTGEVVGEAPVDWMKVLLVVGGIIGGLLVVLKLAGAF
jgi:predicted RNA-binding Zn-ribbon protein involved in translation (DUF1610 family)